MRIDNVLNGREGLQNSESEQNGEISSQENGIRDIYNGNDTAGRDRLTESIEIISGEMNARLSQDIDSLMDTKQEQINRAISPAINDRVLPEIMNIFGNLPLDRPQIDLVMRGRS